MFKPISGGSFGGVKLTAPVAKPEEKPKPTGSLFGNTAPATGGSLFGNLNTVQKSDSAPTKPGSLFGGNPVASSTDSNQKFGLFNKGAETKAADVSAKPEEKKAGLFGSTPAPAAGQSIFGAPAPAGGLFGAAKPPASGSLFGGVPAGGSLFGNAKTGPSIFAFGGSTAPKKEEDDDEDEVEEGEKSPPSYADTTNVEFKGAGA